MDLTEKEIQSLDVILMSLNPELIEMADLSDLKKRLREAVVKKERANFNVNF